MKITKYYNWNVSGQSVTGLFSALLRLFLVMLLTTPPHGLAEEKGVGENWPSFRGPNGTGIAEGQDPPVTWDVETGDNVLWKTPLPGLGHSSVTVWGDRLFITSAEGEGAEPEVRPGIFGESPDTPEDFIHHYRLFCLDKKSGEILWKKTSFSGKPKVKRHVKSSHANCTPPVDGKHVIAFFGSQGLYCYDMDGNLKWQKDLGYLDAGAFNAPETQWGFGNSPILYKDKVIVVCDVNNQSFIAAFDVKDGREIWRTLRDEVPTWTTPTIYEKNGSVQAIVNGWKHIGGYDVETGEALWWMAGGGDVPIPRPVVAHDLVFITNSHGRLRPIYAIRPTSRGDISLADGETSNEGIAWANLRRGAYIPTPIVYGDYLYILNWNGILTCYKAKTGEELYRERTADQRSAYSASPVIAGGKIYITSEYGDVHVVKAGPEYELLASNTMGEITMSTPSISENTLFVRTKTALYGLKEGTSTALKPAKEKSVTVTASIGSTVEVRDDKKVALAAPDRELTNPIEILKHVDAAAKNVETVMYYIKAQGTGAAEEKFASAEGKMIATGLIDGFPARFVADGELRPADGSVALKFTGGSDGDKYYVIDHAAKTAHIEFDMGVMGKYINPILGGIFREFHVKEPFSDEIDGEKVELMDSEKVGDEECYVVRVIYSVERQQEAIWHFSKNDFLPRSRHDRFVMEDGEKGGVVKELTRVVVDPPLASDVYEIKIPPGYKRSSEPAQ